eukprot:366335-Chlamydomonas_euryale.AAC.4
MAHVQRVRVGSPPLAARMPLLPSLTPSQRHTRLVAGVNDLPSTLTQAPTLPPPSAQAFSHVASRWCTATFACPCVMPCVQPCASCWRTATFICPHFMPHSPPSLPVLSCLHRHTATFACPHLMPHTSLPLPVLSGLHRRAASARAHCELPGGVRQDAVRACHPAYCGALEARLEACRERGRGGRTRLFDSSSTMQRLESAQEGHRGDVRRYQLRGFCGPEVCRCQRSRHPDEVQGGALAHEHNGSMLCWEVGGARPLAQGLAGSGRAARTQVNQSTKPIKSISR